jgi:hypothetical protein
VQLIMCDIAAPIEYVLHAPYIGETSGNGTREAL